MSYEEKTNTTLVNCFHVTAYLLQILECHTGAQLTAVAMSYVGRHPVPGEEWTGEE